MSRVTQNPFTDGSRPPGDHALTLFLGRRAGILAEIGVSLLERSLTPVWVWGGPDWGWALQTQTPGVPLIVVRERALDLEAVVAFHADALGTLHASPHLSNAAKHRIPLTVKGSDYAYAYVELVGSESVDLLLELLDARVRVEARPPSTMRPV
jgi:hypothetical protein